MSIIVILYARIDSKREHFKLLLKRVRQQFICVYLRPFLPICQWNICNWVTACAALAGASFVVDVVIAGRPHQCILTHWKRKLPHRNTTLFNLLLLLKNPTRMDGKCQGSRDKIKNSKKKWRINENFGFSLFSQRRWVCLVLTTHRHSMCLHCSISFMQSTWTRAGTRCLAVVVLLWMASKNNTSILTVEQHTDQESKASSKIKEVNFV